MMELTKDSGLGAVIKYLEQVHARADQSVKNLTHNSREFDLNSKRWQGLAFRASIHREYRRELEKVLLHLDRIRNS